MEEDDESDSSDASGKPANDSVTNDPVERLLADCLAALEDSGERGMEEVLDAQPEHAQQVRESVQALRSAGLVESPTIYDDDFPETLGDFRLLHRLGRGGMGVVYLAEQQSLGRQVALKLIRPEMMFFEGSRDRFRREVETVAGLQHPGIVAVHSVGDEGGVPYFAMEYVRGKSLEELLSATSKRDAAELTGRDLDPSGTGSGYLFSGTWEEACLRVMRQVCEALEFAHQRGILHRDIKPSNIMISEDGASRVLLLDFGLSSDRSSSEMTQSGSRLGSLRYMSSEQLRGSRSEMGAHTDVYGVGVTLYEMMVQAPAFEAPSDAEIVLAIQRGTLPLLRTRNTACSWEVETICATATDQEPRRRYATSADMARDLANALEHRPIEARRAGVVLRSKRWIERRPAMATAVGFVLLLLIGGPLTFAWQQHKASIVIAAERDRAVQAYDSAMEAVDRMLSRLGEEDLKLIPAMGLVRRKVFEDAVALLEKLVDAADGEAPGRERFELARAHQRIGALLRELGHAADAAVALSNARDLYLELRADPARVEVEADDLTEFIAAATVSFADCQRESGELDAALSTIVSLDEFLEEALVARPDSRMLRYYKTTNKQARAMILDAQGLRDESRDAYLESIAELEAQGTEGERDLLAMRAKKSIWGAYGLLLMESFSTEQGLHPDVLDLLERTAGMAAQIAEHESALPGDTRDLAIALSDLGGAHRRSGDFEGARDCYLDAIDSLEQLTGDFPNMLTYGNALATAYNQLGLVHDFLGQYGECEEYYQRAMEQLESMCEASPRMPVFHQRLAITRYNLSSMLRRDRELTGAEALVEDGIRSVKRAIQLAPDDADYRATYLDLLIARWLLRADVSDYRAVAQRALEVGKALPDIWIAQHRAAVGLMKAIDLVRADKLIGADERETLAQEYILMLCERLEIACQVGAPFKGQIRTMQSFADLRDEPSFQDLLLFDEE